MNRFSQPLAYAVCILIYLAAFGLAAQDKPLLSKEIAGVIESQGIAAAKQRFEEIFPAQKDAYEIDSQGLMELGMAFMQSGNMDAGTAVIEMTTTVNMAMMKDAMNTISPEMAQIQAEMEKAEKAEQQQAVQNREQEQAMQQQAEARARGKSRSDLGRFTGLYGDPADTGRTRMIFVTVSCDGYLVSGAMWADVGAWWMRSAADTVFTYADSFANISMEFGMGEDGKANTLTHDLEGVTSPMERLDDLPADWPECLERQGR